MQHSIFRQLTVSKEHIEDCVCTSYCVTVWWCCVVSYLKAFTTWPNHLVFQRDTDWFIYVTQNSYLLVGRDSVKVYFKLWVRLMDQVKMLIATSLGVLNNQSTSNVQYLFRKLWISKVFLRIISQPLPI